MMMYVEKAEDVKAVVETEGADICESSDNIGLIEKLGHSVSPPPCLPDRSDVQLSSAFCELGRW